MKLSKRSDYQNKKKIKKRRKKFDDKQKQGKQYWSPGFDSCYCLYVTQYENCEKVNEIQWSKAREETGNIPRLTCAIFHRNCSGSDLPSGRLNLCGPVYSALLKICIAFISFPSRARRKPLSRDYRLICLNMRVPRTCWKHNVLYFPSGAMEGERRVLLLLYCVETCNCFVNS